MVTTRLEINDVSQAMITDIPVSINFVQADLREPDKRNASFSKTITLNGTNEINILFENIFETNIATGYFNVNKKTPVKYFVNEIENFRGNLQLLKVSKKPDNSIVYECAIIGEGGNLFKDIGDAYLEDLDFSEYNHNYSREKIIDSWTNLCDVNGVATALANGEGYLYGFVHRGLNGGSDWEFSVSDFMPQLYAREIFFKILDAHGYSWNTSGILDSAEFKSIVVEPNISTIGLSASQIANAQFNVGLNADFALTLNTDTIVLMPNESSPFFDAGNQVSAGIATLNYAGWYNFAASDVFDIYFTHTDPSVAYAAAAFTVNTRIWKSGDGGATWFVMNNSYRYFNVPVAANVFNVNTNYQTTNAVATGEQFFSTDKIRHTAEIRFPVGNTILYYDSLDNPIATGTATWTYKLKSGSTGSSFYGLSTRKQLTEGNVLELNNALPKKIKQKDFIKSIMQAFNLYIDVDRNNPKLLTIETYTDYFDNGVVDWENKIDLDEDIVTNPVSLIDGKQYTYKYKDDKDYFNNLYLTNYNESFGTEIIDVDNDFITATKKNELIFSPTPNVANYYMGIAMPKIFKEDPAISVKSFTPNIRLLYYNGVKQSYYPWAFKKINDTTLLAYDYPEVGHTDDYVNPTKDLNFGTPKEVYYSYTNTYFTNNNLYNRFHKPFIDNTTSRDSKVIIANLWLTPTDIYNFSFRKKYFIAGAYYLVNKIVNYNPMEMRSTKVELIKYLGDYSFTPTQILLSDSPAIPSGGGVIAQRQNNSQTLGNSINLGTNCLAIGDGIFIPASATNVTVIGDNITIEEDASDVTYINGVKETASNPGIVFVYSLSDFPTAVSSIITLLDNVTYFICASVDLLGSRLVCGQNTVLIGGSSENCRLLSTGLSASTALITSEWSLPIRSITIEHGTAIALDATANADQALDWFGVNFYDCATIGTIKNYNNFLMSDSAFLDSQGLTFDGTFGTIAFSGCLFQNKLTTAAIILPSTLTISRRFRIIYSSFVTLTTRKSLDVSTSATIGDERYILDTVNFSGGGTYLTGVTDTSNKALFVNCVGITNTNVNGQLYMVNNATVTTIGVINTFYKVAGTTTASTDNEKYLHSNNRLTNDAVIPRKFLIQCNLSFNSTVNNVCEFGFYDSVLATVRTPSKTKSTANAAGRAENISFNCVVTHQQNDYLEIWCSNTTGANNITVTDMNFVITEIR